MHTLAPYGLSSRYQAVLTVFGSHVIANVCVLHEGSLKQLDGQLLGICKH